MKTIVLPMHVLLATAMSFTVVGCANTAAMQKVKQQRLHGRLNNALKVGGSPLEDTYYACLLNGIEQGLPLDQIRQDCAIEAIDLSSKGYGDTRLPGTPDTGPIRTETEPFDPRTVSAACHSGDPRRGAGKQTNSTEPVGYRGSDAFKESSKVPPDKKDAKGADGKLPLGGEGYGYGTYGGKDKKDEETGLPYKGLSKEESMDKKAEAIMKANEALEKYRKAADAAIAETDPVKKAQLVNEATKAKQEWEKALEKAQDDPNLGIDSSQTTGEITPCEEALQSAREFLYECHRTGWKYPGCASMEAAKNHCPDPTQIYVDPDGEYACVQKIDTEALKNAWVAKCEELVQFDPGGDNPCHPPKFDGKGRFAPQDRYDNFCESTPETYIEPGSSSCIKVFEIRPFGEPDLQKLYVWGLKNLGGPVVVIPDKDPKPPVGPGPGPDPTPPQ
jgi:hypothetical protein